MSRSNGEVVSVRIIPNEKGNHRDGLFRPELVMKMAERGQGAFDFVVAG